MATSPTRGSTALLLTIAVLTAPGAAADSEWGCRAENGNWVCREQSPARSEPSPQTPAESGEEPDWSLGWVPLDELSAEQLTPDLLAQVPDHCCGVYIPPEPLVADGAQADVPPEQAEILLEYDQLQGNLQTTYELSGDVTITQGNRRVTADRAIMDEITDTATLSGNINLYEPGILVVGDGARVNRDTGAAVVDDGRFVLYESRTRGSAGRISRSEDEVLTLEDGRFTQCEPDREHWVLRGSSISVDTKKNWGVARDARLELGGVPVFYWPYLPFPVGDERKSGFLFPTVSSDDVAVPYYLNLAPHYDLTLTPRYVVDRGAMLEAEFRHLAPLFETVLGGAFLPGSEDDITSAEREAVETGLITEAEATEFDGEDRWLASVQQTGGIGRDWFTEIDYTRVSDYAYFNQLDTTNLEVNRATHLRQAGEAGIRLPNWTVNTRVVDYQTIALDIEQPYEQLPEINARGDYQWGDLALNLDNELTRFSHSEKYLDEDTPSPTRRRITGSRARLDYELAWEKEWLWGFFRPAALLKNISYDLDEEALRPDAETNPNITVPQGAVDMGLFFERDGSWFGNGYLQTFEPRIFYFYSDYQSHSELFDVTPDNRNVDFDTSELSFSYSQLFRTRRFAGGDRIGDTNQVSVGLTTRFIGETGAERLNLSLGQIFYQDDRRVTLTGEPQLDTRSEMAGRLSAELTDSLRLSSDVLYDDHRNRMNRGNINLRYLDDDNRIFNIGYRYDRRPPRTVNGESVDQTRSQGDASLVWPVSDSWTVIGRQYYDFTNDRELDSIAGLEYTSCCYRFRIVWRRWLDNELITRVHNPTLDLEYDQGVFFELQLRGLGGVGSSNVSSALGDGIYNFNRREEAIVGRPVD